MKLNNFFKLVIAIGICELAGITGSVFTALEISTWYKELTKPTLNPPAWVFGPVWITLYALIGIAFFLIWSFEASRGKKQHSNILENMRMLRVQKTSIILFFVQLFLNSVWSIIFFGLHSPEWAFVDIILLLLAISGTMIVFYKISKPATYLLVPYLLWTCFASYLNYSIWILN